MSVILYRPLARARHVHGAGPNASVPWKSRDIFPPDPIPTINNQRHGRLDALVEELCISSRGSPRRACVARPIVRQARTLDAMGPHERSSGFVELEPSKHEGEICPGRRIMQSILLRGIRAPLNARLPTPSSGRHHLIRVSPRQFTYHGTRVAEHAIAAKQLPVLAIVQSSWCTCGV